MVNSHPSFFSDKTTGQSTMTAQNILVLQEWIFANEKKEQSSFLLNKRPFLYLLAKLTFDDCSPI
jgi:hypothetical protein